VQQSVSEYRDGKKERNLKQAQNISADGVFAGMHKQVVWTRYLFEPP